MDLSPAVWKKASRSNDSGDACVELASNGEIVAIRDGKDSDGAKIFVVRGDFRRLAEMLKDL